MPNGQHDPTQSPPAPPNEGNLKILFHQYETLVGLYKHHLDITLKTNIFIYAITGAILSFYFSKPQCNGILRYSLIFPSFLNLSYAVFFFLASTKITPFDNDIKAISRALGLMSYPDVRFLKYALRMSSLLFLMVAIGLIIITIINN
jgi:hypothetical protein